jgi:hypothetical protein
MGRINLLVAVVIAVWAVVYGYLDLYGPSKTTLDRYRSYPSVSRELLAAGQQLEVYAAAEKDRDTLRAKTAMDASGRHRTEADRLARELYMQDFWRTSIYGGLILAAIWGAAFYAMRFARRDPLTVRR